MQHVLTYFIKGIRSVETATQDVNTVADRQLLMKQSFNRRAIGQAHLQKLNSQIQQVRVSHAHAQTQGKQSTVNAQAQQLAELQTQHSELRSDLGAALGGSQSLSQMDYNSDLRSSQEVSSADLRRSASDSVRSSHDQLAQQKSPLDKQVSLSALDQQKEENFSFRNSMEIAKPAPNVMEPAKSGYLFRKSKLASFFMCMYFTNI